MYKRQADSRPIYSLAAPELLELPSVGTAKEFDLEGCAALEPDLVVLPLKLKEDVYKRQIPDQAFFLKTGREIQSAKGLSYEEVGHGYYCLKLQSSSAVIELG